jgi:hypothetical protein
MRFYDIMLEEAKYLSLENWIVLMPHINCKTDFDDSWSAREIEEYKDTLNDMHLAKIDLADAVYVVDVDGYLGESTKAELEYARRAHCLVFYRSIYRRLRPGLDTNELTC